MSHFVWKKQFELGWKNVFWNNLYPQNPVEGIPVAEEGAVGFTAMANQASRAKQKGDMVWVGPFYLCLVELWKDANQAFHLLSFLNPFFCDNTDMANVPHLGHKEPSVVGVQPFPPEL